MSQSKADRSILECILGDGRFLVLLTGLALLGSGGFVVFQSISGYFLPHDTHALGMDAAELSRRATPQLVAFMFHDRVAFGGVLLALGSIYGWLSTFPLRDGEPWAWWALLLSGVVGFASFLAYLGYGYLDTWHGAGTLCLLPVFVVGLWRSRALVRPLAISQIWGGLRRPESRVEALGRLLLIFTACGIISAGLVIVVVGMTVIFVPQDIAFIGLNAEQMRTISPRLLPVVAHDRAGFGGGLASTGILILLLALNARLTRNFIEIILTAGLSGFGCAIVTHHVIGYTNPAHLLPAYFGFFTFLGGWLACVIAREKQAALPSRAGAKS